MTCALTNGSVDAAVAELSTPVIEEMVTAKEPAPANSADAGVATSIDPGPHCTGEACNRCGDNQEACGAQCVDLRSDAQHCGACGQACLAAIGGDSWCAAGRCANDCPAGFIECAGRCVDANSQNSCGSCEPCGADQRCVAGRCVSECPIDMTLCDGTCVDLSRDAQHCGACGSACPTGDRVVASCEASQCQLSCTPGFTLCHSACVAEALILEVDLGNLGGLSNCDAFAAPKDAAQAIACAPEQTICDGICVDLLSDATHCGTCDSTCPAPTQCRMARCERE